MIREKADAAEARKRAEAMQADPRVRAWMRRARRLFKDLPAAAWIYWEEDALYLMALGPNGERYVDGYNHGGGSDQSAVIDSVHVPGSDCGAW